MRVRGRFAADVMVRRRDRRGAGRRFSGGDGFAWQVICVRVPCERFAQIRGGVQKVEKLR